MLRQVFVNHETVPPCHLAASTCDTWEVCYDSQNDDHISLGEDGVWVIYVDFKLNQASATCEVGEWGNVFLHVLISSQNTQNLR